MATPLTISVNLESNAAEQMRQLTASITASLSGIDAKMQDTARKTGQSTEAWRTNLTGLAQATTQAMGGLGAVSQAVLQTGQAIQKAVNPFAILRKEIEGSPPAMTKMVKGLQDLAQQVIRTHAEQGNLSKAFLQTGKAAETQLTSFQKLQQSYQKTQQTAAGLSREMSTLFKGLAAAAGVSISIQGLIAFGQSVVEAGIAHDRLMLSLKGALGTAQAAGEAYQFVEGVANRLGIGLLTAVEGFAKLSAATQGTVVQGQQTRDLFVAISEASRVMGLTSAETGGIVTALTQIIGKNTVSMEELRQQLGERLPSALRLTAKEMGVTTSRFIEMVSKGEVLATDFIPAVTRAMQQMGKEAPAAAASVQAALERLGNAWFTLKVTIANSGVLTLIAQIAEEATKAINEVTNLIDRSNRLSGTRGILAMQQEFTKLAQQIHDIQTNADPIFSGGGTARGNERVKALTEQMTALGDKIIKAQMAQEGLNASRTKDEAATKQDIENAAAKEREIALISKATTVWTGNAEAIKQNELALKALRSFDVDVLKQAFQIDPFAPDFESRFKEAEAILLKQQKDLLDKRAGLNKGAAAREIQEAGESAVERAKAVEEALATSLQRQERQIEISADLQRQAIAKATSTALATEGPGAVEAIAAQHARQMQAVVEQTAAALETLRQNTLTEQAAAREVTLKAEIEAAGKNLSARVKAEEDLRKLHQDTENQRANITKQRGDADQKTAEQRAQAEIKHARDLNKLIREIEDERIQARIDLADEQIGLIEAQVQGEVLTVQQGQQQIQALEAKRFDDLRLKYTRAAQEQIAEVERVVQATVGGEAAIVEAKALAAQQIEQINQGLTTQLAALDVQQQTNTQQALNEQTQSVREWVRDVQSELGNFLFEWFDGQIKGIGDLLDRLKSYFFKIIADMVAYAATQQIIVPIVGSFLGGFGGGGAGGAAGSALQGAGVLSQLLGIGGGGGAVGSAAQGFGIMDALGITTGLKTISAGLGVGVDMLTDALVMGAGRISQFFGGGAVGTWDAATVTIGGATNLGGAAAGIGGGLAALGAGIYSALNAANTASRAAFAASAAAGAVATTSAAAGAGLLGASAATGALTGWTGIGLIVAAVMAVIGTVLDKVIKPEGPTVAVGAPGGLNVGAEGGRLQVQGDAGTRVFRREGVDPGMARGIQAQLEEGITNAAIAAIDTINAVALDPEKLLGPTQAALQAALKNVATINSSNAKKMEQDLTEQLRFANVQFIGGLLEPINRAFDQLRDMGDLEEQIQQLPGKTAGLIAIFTNLNQQLGEMGASKNTDVLRQLSAVKNQVENFGNRIAGTAGQIAEEIVTSIIEQMQQTVVPTLAGQITQFSGLMNESFRALNTLRSTQQMLEGAGLQGGGVGTQIDRLTRTMSEQAERISTEIVSGALRDLAEELDQILVQPLRVQATTVNGLFTDSMAALQALWNEWHRLEAEGIDAGRVRQQFDRLLGGMLDSVQQITEQAFATGPLTEFLRVLLSIPEALANMNPVTQQIRQMGLVFAQVAGPIQEVIDAVSLELQTPAQRAADAAMRITELNAAIAQTGDSIDQALPLYAQLSQAIQASAQAQIEVVNEQAEAQTTAIQEAYDAQVAIIQAWAEQASTLTNIYFDAITQAYDDWFDQEIATANAYYDAASEASEAWFDSQLTALNGAFDDQRDAWDRWAEDMTAGLEAFVETSTTWINGLADAANTTASQVETLNRAVLAEMSPAEQRSTLEARRDVFRAQAAGGGPGAAQAMTELISINQDLLALAKQSDNLALQKQATDELRVLQKIMTDRLVEQTGESDPVLAQIKVALIQERYLKDIADYQRRQTEYITQTQQAAQEDVERRRRDHLDTLEVIRVRVQADFEAKRQAHLDTLEVIRVRVQEAFEIARNQKLDEIEAIREAHEEKLASDRDAELKNVAHWQEETVNAIKKDMVYQLQLVQYELQKMFAMQYQVLTGIALQAPVHPGQQLVYDPTTGGVRPAVLFQRGGAVGLASGLYYAQGGMVPAMLEPQERVVYPPMSMAQQGALMGLNAAFPRFANGGFTVPGHGTGDTVPAWLPSGSFVLNKNAARAIGHQGGGMVHGSSAPAMPPIVIDLRGSRFGSVADAHKVKDILEKDVVRIMEEYQKKIRVNTRIR